MFYVDFSRLSIALSPNCSGDKVQLFDGDTDTPLSERICGHDLPSQSFVTQSSILIVQFQSDEAGNDDGFVIGYKVVEGGSDLGEINDIPALSGHRSG